MGHSLTCHPCVNKLPTNVSRRKVKALTRRDRRWGPSSHCGQHRRLVPLTPDPSWTPRSRITIKGTAPQLRMGMNHIFLPLLSLHSDRGVNIYRTQDQRRPYPIQSFLVSSLYLSVSPSSTFARVSRWTRTVPFRDSHARQHHQCSDGKDLSGARIAGCTSALV